MLTATSPRLSDSEHRCFCDFVIVSQFCILSNQTTCSRRWSKELQLICVCLFCILSYRTPTTCSRRWSATSRLLYPAARWSGVEFLPALSRQLMLSWNMSTVFNRGWPPQISIFFTWVKSLCTLLRLPFLAASSRAESPRRRSTTSWSPSWVGCCRSLILMHGVQFYLSPF